jgi:hypothetical protein
LAAHILSIKIEIKLAFPSNQLIKRAESGEFMGIRKSASSAYVPLAFFAALLMLALSMTCGGGGGGGGGGVIPPATGFVTATISDPLSCQIPNGPFKNVWVTITLVRAHTSSTAGPNDSGWATLVDLQNNPTQIDLLSLPSPDCLLTQLGSTIGIAAGQYQQIRLHLLSNNPGPGEALPAPNNCNGSGFNCVVAADGTIQTLLVSSESQTGIKIPSGQIAGGNFTVTANQGINLNIDFDACSSIVQQGNGQFRLKPVLHAGEISLNSNSISGIVVDSLSHTPITNAIVFVEQPDPTNPNIDRIIAQTTTVSQGQFIICPLPPGTYDVVAAAKTTSPSVTTYNATITLQVPSGTTMGNIPLVPGVAITPATVSGQVTTTSPVGLPTTADINLSALQPVGSLLVTIPPLENSTPNVTSDGGSVSYTLVLPAGNPQVGTFNGSPQTAYTPPISGQGIYQLNARVFTPMSSGSNPGSPDCSPSSLPLSFGASTLVAVSPGAVITQDFTFTGCQ